LGTGSYFSPLIIITTPTIPVAGHSERPKGVKNLSMRGIIYKIPRRCAPRNDKVP